MLSYRYAKTFAEPTTGRDEAPAAVAGPGAGGGGGSHVTVSAASPGDHGEPFAKVGRDSLLREIKSLTYLLKCANDRVESVRVALIAAGEHPDRDGLIKGIRNLAEKAVRS